jgi:hypothetical protein
MEYIEVQTPNQRRKQQFSQPLNRVSAIAAASELDDVGGLGSFLALGHIEADPLIFLEGAESAILDGGVVNKEIGAAFVGRNETETLFRVEPLHGALSHSNFLEMSLGNLGQTPPRRGVVAPKPLAGGFWVWERGMGYFQQDSIGRRKVAKEKI